MKKSYFYTVLFTVCLGFFLSLPAQAANEVMIAVGYDSEGNLVTAAPAVAAVYQGAIYVEVHSALIENSEVSDCRLIAGGKEYPLSFSCEYPELFIVEFVVNVDENDLNILYASDEAYEGEVATLYYFDGEVNEQTASIQITDYKEGSGYYYYDYKLLDTLPEPLFPMALVNDQGRLIGYVAPSGDIYTYLFNPDNFSSSGGSGSGSSSGSGSESGDGSGSGGRTTIPTDETGDGSLSTERVRKTLEEKNPFPVALVIGIVVVAVAAVVVVVLVASKSRKKTPQASSVPPAPAPDVAAPPVNIPPTEAAPAAPRMDAANRVTPILYAEGGVMDGRRYPISAANIVIGRDPSCTICYPDGTPGVSRRHCTLFWQEGVLMLMDTGSSHGTFLQGQGQGQLPPNQPVALKSGDAFYLGEKKNGFILRFE